MSSELARRGSEASYSPNGRRIVFAGESKGGYTDLYTIRADGSHRRPESRTPFNAFDPDWGVESGGSRSPDDQQVVWVLRVRVDRQDAS